MAALVVVAGLCLAVAAVLLVKTVRLTNRQTGTSTPRVTLDPYPHSMNDRTTTKEASHGW